MQLLLLVALYARAKNDALDLGRQLSPKTIQHLDESARAYGAYLTRPADTGDFEAAKLNAFLAHLLAIGRSPWGVKSRRTGLLVLWRFARNAGLVQSPPDGVKRVHCQPLSNDGFDVRQMEQLLGYVSTLRFSVNRTSLPQRLWWDSLLRVKWDLVLRAGDMLRVRPCDFRPEGWLWARESKTGRENWLRLRPSAAESLAAFLAVDPRRSLVWPGYAPKNFYKAFKRLAVRAGVPGTSRFVRRGSASEFEAMHRGAAWQFMRHSTPAVFEHHYRVQRITEREAPGPPELGRAGQHP